MCKLAIIIEDLKEYIDQERSLGDLDYSQYSNIMYFIYDIEEAIGRFKTDINKEEN